MSQLILEYSEKSGREPKIWGLHCFWHTNSTTRALQVGSYNKGRAWDMDMALHNASLNATSTFSEISKELYPLYHQWVVMGIWDNCSDLLCNFLHAMKIYMHYLTYSLLQLISQMRKLKLRDELVTKPKSKYGKAVNKMLNVCLSVSCIYHWRGHHL